MKTWILELEDEADADSVAYEIIPLPEIYRVKVMEYEQNPMEGIRELWKNASGVISRITTIAPGEIEPENSILFEMAKVIKKAVGK
jgi:hypothetical protein